MFSIKYPDIFSHHVNRNIHTEWCVASGPDQGWRPRGSELKVHHAPTLPLGQDQGKAWVPSHCTRCHFISLNDFVAKEEGDLGK